MLTLPRAFTFTAALAILVMSGGWLGPGPTAVGGSPLLFSSLLGAGSEGSSLLSALALAHLQHKADAVAQLAELLAAGANATEALFLN